MSAAEVLLDAVGDVDNPAKVEIPLTTDIHEAVDASATALALHPDLFQRSGRLVQVIRVDGDQGCSSGTPQIHELALPCLTSELTRVAQFTRTERNGNVVNSKPPQDVVAALYSRGQWPIRSLAGVLETPVMRPDGTILQSPGYDRATGFLYAPGSIAFPVVPDAPTQEQARSSLAELTEVFADFPYAAPAHLSVAIAAALTPLVRPAIAGNVPAFVFDATTPGSGKTLQAEIVATLATGRPISKVTYPSSLEELEKILGGYARKGVGLFSFDNVASAFGGGPLDKVLTCGGSVDLRILGKSDVPTFPWRSVIIATGNNVVYQGDTSRRILMSRLQPSVENPENRDDSTHPDRWGSERLLAWVQRERPRLVVAGLTVVRAYVAAGRPDVGVKAWGSFEGWSRLVASAIVWAGGANPQDGRPADDSTIDPEKDAIRTVLMCWPEPRGTFISTNDLVSRKLADPDFRTALDTLAPARPGEDQKRAIGRMLKKWEGRVVSGQRLESELGGRAKVRTWRVVG